MSAIAQWWSTAEPLVAHPFSLFLILLIPSILLITHWLERGWVDQDTYAD